MSFSLYISYYNITYIEVYIMGILSIQSHVVYGYVGNKAATYPLQAMGYDVWPINTVQFSSHTGYDNWKGEVFSREHIRDVIKGIEALGMVSKCQAILSGYMGSHDTCLEVLDIVTRFKKDNKDILYLCDPVIGNDHCYVKPEVLEFFKTNLKADIITPNQFEAEILSGIKIIDIKSLKKVADYFHNLGVLVVAITGIKNIGSFNLSVFVSDGFSKDLIEVQTYDSKIQVNGTGDLFSAVFLGTYISTKNALESAKNATYYLDQVMRKTFEIKARELQVISANYDIATKNMNSILI